MLKRSPRLKNGANQTELHISLLLKSVTAFSQLYQMISKTEVAKTAANRSSSLSNHAKVQRDLTRLAAEQEAGEAQEEEVPMLQEQVIEAVEVPVIAKAVEVDEEEAVQLEVDSVVGIVEDEEEADVVVSTRTRVHRQHQRTLPPLLLLPTLECCIAKYPSFLRYR